MCRLLYQWPLPMATTCFNVQESTESLCWVVFPAVRGLDVFTDTVPLPWESSVRVITISAGRSWTGYAAMPSYNEGHSSNPAFANQAFNNQAWNYTQSQSLKTCYGSSAKLALLVMTGYFFWSLFWYVWAVVWAMFWGLTYSSFFPCCCTTSIFNLRVQPLCEGHVYLSTEK